MFYNDVFYFMFAPENFTRSNALISVAYLKINQGEERLDPEIIRKKNEVDSSNVPTRATIFSQSQGGRRSTYHPPLPTSYTPLTNVYFIGFFLVVNFI